MELKTIMYCGLTGAKLTFFFTGMLVLSDISVLLHMPELRHCGIVHIIMLLSLLSGHGGGCVWLTNNGQTF